MSKNQPFILKPFQEKVTSTSYFFRNNKIDKNIYIAQPSQSIYNALHIIDTWNSEGYNDIGTSEELVIPYNLYIYRSNNDIKLEKIEGGNDDFKVLVFYKNKKINVIALLLFE